MVWPWTAVRSLASIALNLRASSQSLRRLLDGETVCFSDYPNLLEYFNFNPKGSFKLNFSPKTPILQYCGANGPLGLAVGGQDMDGGDCR